MPKYPICYFLRRTFVVLNGGAIYQLGYEWSDILFPDCEVWRMNWFAMHCNVNINDIHAFAADGGKWRYCFAQNVRPFVKYNLIY